jgi:uncharacterized protein (TIGR00369 family)
MDLKKVDRIIKAMLSLKQENRCSYGNELLRGLVLLDSHHIIRNPSSELVFKLKVENQFCNLFGLMHSGAISTLVDISTTILVSACDKNARHNVSVELSTKYLNPIKNDSHILIHCMVPKTGKSLAF